MEQVNEEEESPEETSSDDLGLGEMDDNTSDQSSSSSLDSIINSKLGREEEPAAPEETP